MTSWTGWAIALALSSTLAIYIGYPVWLLWMTRGRKLPRQGRPARVPTVCIVVAAHDEEACIQARIENLQTLRYPPDALSFLVVADGCTDRTEDIVATFSDPRVRLLSHRLRQGKVNALNAAALAADAEILVGTDANCWFEPDCLTHLLAPFSDPSVSCVAGSKRIWPSASAVGSGEGWYWRYESWLKERDALLGSVMGVTGEVFAIRRACYEPLPADAVIEDFVLAVGQVAAGHRVAYAPLATAWETPSATWAGEFERKTRIVAGAWQALRWMQPLLWPPRGVTTAQLVGHRLLRWMFVPWSWAIALVACVTEVCFRPGLLSCGLLLGLGLTLLSGARRGSGLSHAVLYFAFTQAAACAGAIRHFTGRQAVTWTRVPRSPMPS